MTLYNVTGWGKGKTTSAIGISVRALANEEKVLFVQFLKDGSDGGLRYLDYFNKDFTHIYQGTKGFNIENCERFWLRARQAIKNIKPNLVILDEMNVALDNNLLGKTFEEIVEEIKELAKDRDVYITGRINNHYKRHKMFEISDIATNCYCVVHNYNASCIDCDKEYPRDFTFCPVCGRKLVQKDKAKKGREY